MIDLNVWLFEHNDLFIGLYLVAVVVLIVALIAKGVYYLEKNSG